MIVTIKSFARVRYTFVLCYARDNRSFSLQNFADKLPFKRLPNELLSETQIGCRNDKMTSGHSRSINKKEKRDKEWENIGKITLFNIVRLFVDILFRSKEGDAFDV